MGPASRLAIKYRISLPIVLAIRTVLPSAASSANCPSIFRMAFGSPLRTSARASSTVMLKIALALGSSRSTTREIVIMSRTVRASLTPEPPSITPLYSSSTASYASQSLQKPKGDDDRQHGQASQMQHNGHFRGQRRPSLKATLAPILGRETFVRPYRPARRPLG